MANKVEKETKPKKKKITKTVENKEMKKERVVQATKKENVVQEPKKETVVHETRQENVTKKKFKKKSYNFNETIIVMVLSIIIGILVGHFLTGNMCKKNHPKELEDFNKVYMEIRENSYKKVGKKDLVNSALKGLVYGLNDRYSYIDDSKTSTLEYKEELNGYYTGLGVTVNINENGKISVVSVKDGSPAAKAGIESGDLLVNLNGEEYDSSNYNDFTYELKSSKNGRTIDMEILRNNERIKKEIELDKVEVESVSYYVKEEAGKQIGVFTINNFADNTYDQFYDYYENNKIILDGIIIDVRCNSEGKMENAAKIASLFLEKDSVIYYNYKNGEYTAVKNDNYKKIDLPVVVIINKGTISSGEMLASALNIGNKTPIVGEQSFGKGYLQKMVKLANGKSLYFTVGEWTTAKKEKVEEVGITPTYEISCNEEICSDDNAISKSVEILLNR